MHRLWLILAMVHSALINEGRNGGLCAIAKAPKALSKATRQKGQWAGAWPYTYLPEIGEVLGGASPDEEASIGRFVRDKAATAKAISEAGK